MTNVSQNRWEIFENLCKPVTIFSGFLPDLGNCGKRYSFVLGTKNIMTNGSRVTQKVHEPQGLVTVNRAK